MARQEDLIWAAGFFDGEGCISIQKQQKQTRLYYYMSVSVYQNDCRPLDDFLELFGGSILPEAPAQKWRASGRTAAAMLSEMLPYLRVKREQAITAIAFQERRLPVGKKRPTNFSIAPDERDYVRCRELKKVI